ncbi:hypothetical protein OPQ81_006768 [Rhizoctonia solani]|nr:hypothetical protein OPQ81_006768 [Rhizoctonia solani]
MPYATGKKTRSGAVTPAPTSSTPVTSSSSTPVQSPTETTSATPTNPTQSSEVVSQSSISTISTVSTESIASTQFSAGTRSITGTTTNAAGPSTRVITSFIPNGSGGTVTVVFTSTSAGPTASPSNSGSSSNTGAIVGGVVGGVGGLLLLIALLWFIRRKTHKDKYEENMFAPDRNVDRGEMDLAGDDVHDPEVIARPYHLPPLLRPGMKWQCPPVRGPSLPKAMACRCLDNMMKLL